MAAEAVAMQRALEAIFERFYGVFEGARFERRGDLILASYPSFPIPQCNGPWVIEDTREAVAALPSAIAEVEATGAWPWVQTRSGHDRTRRAAEELGLTHAERVPGMALRPSEFADVDAELDIGPVADGETDEVNELLATTFGAPKELFDKFCGGLGTLDEVSWYAGRADETIVCTSLGFTIGGVTGIFNVATPPEQRGRGYGAALTARAVRDGLARGAELAVLQSSEAGHGVYRRLGFRDVEEYILLTRPA